MLKRKVNSKIILFKEKLDKLIRVRLIEQEEAKKQVGLQKMRKALYQFIAAC